MNKHKFYIGLVLGVSLVVGGVLFIQNSLASTRLLVTPTSSSWEAGNPLTYLFPAVQVLREGEDITSSCEVISSINAKEVGDYPVTLTCKVWGLFPISTTTSLRVEDHTPPSFALTHGNIYYSKTGQPFQETYVLSDNSNSPITVTIKDSFDIHKPGTYYVNYVATDESGNEAYAAQQVIVGDQSEEEFENEKFSLSKWAEALPEHLPLSSYQFSHYLFIGDSNTRNLMYDELVNAMQVVAKPCFGPSNCMVNGYTFAAKEDPRSLNSILTQYALPSIVLLGGQCESNYEFLDTFIQRYEAMVTTIQKAAPHARIIVTLLFPYSSDSLDNRLPNSAINAYNAALAQWATHKGYPILNPAELLKDETGLGNPDYFEEDGYHLNLEGQRLFVQYLYTHLPQ